MHESSLKEVPVALPAVAVSGAGLYELLQLRPLVGTRWRHFKGGLYQISHFSLRKEDLAPLVTYARNSPAGPIPYTCPWHEFAEQLRNHHWTDASGIERVHNGPRFACVTDGGPPAAAPEVVPAAAEAVPAGDAILATLS